jgi:hypothetical protein
VVREGVGAGGRMNQALYAHMNNKRKMKKKKKDIAKTFIYYIKQPFTHPTTGIKPNTTLKAEM